MHILDEREDRDWLKVVEVGGERATNDRSIFQSRSYHGPWETYLDAQCWTCSAKVPNQG